MHSRSPRSAPRRRPTRRSPPRGRELTPSKWNSDLARVIISTVISFVVMFIVIVLLVNFTAFDLENLIVVQITAFVILWISYTLVYVPWGTWVYSHLDQATLARQTAADDEDERKPLTRLLAMTGTTNTTISAAVLAVGVTVLIAQRPEFRGEAIYVVAALLTVASS